jgi:uncharacterized delta-60 repeat protein
MNLPKCRLRVEQLEDRIALNAGDLDLSFNGTGKVNFSFGFTDSLTSVVVQSDSKVVAGGSSANDFALARFNDDGSLDTTFGTGGRVQTDFGGGNDFILGMALQADGKILAAGQSIAGLGRIALSRYNTDGTLDTSFGTGGKVITQIIPGSSSDKGESVLVQSDGKILVGGETNPSPFAFHFLFSVVRYNADGTVDTTFGTNGAATADFGEGLSLAFGMALQADGKIVLVGQPADNAGLAVARFTSGGTLDSSFGTGGLVETDVPGAFNERGADVAIQADGKIVVAGNAGNESNFSSDILLARYNVNGTLDTSFSGDGLVLLDLGGTTESAESIAISSDGKIVVAGYLAPNGVGLVARFKTDGSLDTGFGSPSNTVIPGIVVTDFSVGGDPFDDVQIGPGGKIVAGGTVNQGSSDSNFGLARYEGANLPPTADAGGPHSVAEGGNVQLDGSGSSDPESPASALVYEWDLDGDGVFGETGSAAARGDEVGINPTFLAAGLDGPGSVTVMLRVTDDAGNTDTDSATINLTNVAPVVGSFTNTSPGGGAAEGEPVSFSGSFSDAGTPDTHTAVIDWGDGTTPEAVTVTEADGFGTLSGSHTYSQGGIYTATLTLTDDDSGAAVATTTAVIAGVGLHNGVLQVIGTEGVDQVLVRDHGSALEVEATLNGRGFPRSFAAADVNEVVVYLFGGNDTASVTKGVTVKAFLDGGAGDDALVGGGGTNILVGGAGADTLTGGDARDILIGGDGADVLSGGGGEDVLIAGRTAFDADKTALDALMAEWNSGRDYLTRVANLRGTGSGPDFAGRLNGNFFLVAEGPGATVFDDNAADRLSGNGGRDWFFANLDSSPFDDMRDRKTDEVLIDID